jgi:hypothetical protein
MSTTEKDLLWRTKAERIIAGLSLAAYTEANTSPLGRKYKKHHPYTIPRIAEELVICLNKNNEVRAKQIFMYELQTAND